MKAKCSFYQSDGTGRDNYIGHNSGGFRHDFKPMINTFNNSTKIDRSSNMRFRVKTREPSDLKIINSGVKYAGDGTGRDSYIIVDYGGTVKKHIARNQLLKNYQENKQQANHNRAMSQKSFASNPNFAKKRPQTQMKGIHKLTSQGGVLPEWNSQYPFGQNKFLGPVTLCRASTAQTLKRHPDFAKSHVEYRGESSAAGLQRRPFNHSQSIDPNKWRQILLKNWNIPHKNF